MTTVSRETIEQIIIDFINTSPENTMARDPDEPSWEEALVGFSAGDDSVFDSYKEHVGEFHFTPAEIFNLDFPGNQTEASELTVISWILLQREATKKDHRAEDFYPSDRWVMARFPGEAFNEALRRHVAESLIDLGVDALAPTLSKNWKIEMSPKFSFASRWSERHAAYASGLGTFGLCDGLITPRGKAHRAGSVIAKIKLEPTPRPYDNHRAYCLYFFDGTCRSCAERCPVDAIIDDRHDKKICWDHAGGTCGKYVKEKFKFDGYGCGLCQTKVPCENGIPEKILKKMSPQQANNPTSG